MIHGYRQIVGGVEFEVHTLFGGEGLIAIEKVNFMAIRGGSRARVPTMTILEFDEDGRIFSIRIYADIADLFRKLESGHGAIARP